MNAPPTAVAGKVPMIIKSFWRKKPTNVFNRQIVATSPQIIHLEHTLTHSLPCDGATSKSVETSYMKQRLLLYKICMSMQCVCVWRWSNVNCKLARVNLARLVVDGLNPTLSRVPCLLLFGPNFDGWIYIPRIRRCHSNVWPLPNRVGWFRS